MRLNVRRQRAADTAGLIGLPPVRGERRSNFAASPRPWSHPVSLPSPSPDTAALVTGASAGIGACIARELAKRGHGLVLVARRRERLEELAEGAVGGSTASGPRRSARTCPRRRRSRGCPGASRASGSRSTILVNNAGFATGGPFYESDPERELEQVRVLVEAPVALISAFAPAMVKRGRGAILNVASTAAIQPLPYSAGYSAAKAYVLDVLRGAPPGAERPRRHRHRAVPGPGRRPTSGRSPTGRSPAGSRSSARCPARR